MSRFAYLLLALLSTSAQAATLTDLYETQVPLLATTEKEEAIARQQGFEQVLVKVSGQTDVLAKSVIKKALVNTDQYITQFGYETLHNQRVLDLTFNPNLIRQLLTDAKATLWSEQRPTVLVWFVDERQGQRHIAWDQEYPDIQKVLNQETKRRGFPILLPIGDIGDATAITVPDLMGGFIKPIATASERYHPDAVLVVRMQPESLESSSPEVQVSWELFANSPSQWQTITDAPKTGDAQGSMVSALKAMIDSVADQLAERHAAPLDNKTQDHLMIRISDVTTPTHFFELERFLASLPSVVSVNTQGIEGHTITFNVNVLGTSTDFSQEVLAGGLVTNIAPLVMGDDFSEMSNDKSFDDHSSDSEASLSVVPESSLNMKDTEVISDAMPTDTSPTFSPDEKAPLQFYWHS